MGSSATSCSPCCTQEMAIALAEEEEREAWSVMYAFVFCHWEMLAKYR